MGDTIVQEYFKYCDDLVKDWIDNNANLTKNDLITGETEEQFQYLDVQAEDGTVLTGEICGYKYVGRKIVERFLSFDGEDSLVVERMFFDKAEDNRLMCQKPTETPLYYFGLADNERVKILH